jgi:hypothetical protein
VVGDGGSLGATGRGGKGKIDRDSIRQLKSDGNQVVGVVVLVQLVQSGSGLCHTALWSVSHPLKPTNNHRRYYSPARAGTHSQANFDS